MSPPIQTGREGFTLLLVIGALTVGALLAAFAAQATRTEAAGVAALGAQARLSAAADGALALAVWRLSAPDEPASRASGDETSARAQPLPGSLQEFTIGATQVTVRVVDETGLADLNQAPARVLAAAFVAAGADLAEAFHLSVEIEDWRDSDSERRPGGAEAADYRRAPSGAFIGDRPFRAVEEARAVASMDGYLFANARAFLTIAGGAEPVPDFMPPAFAQALAEVGNGEAAAAAVASGASDATGPVRGSGRYTAYVIARGEGPAAYAEAVRFDHLADSVQPRILSRRRLSLAEAETLLAGAAAP